jgi:hypothetical protein
MALALAIKTYSHHKINSMKNKLFGILLLFAFGISCSKKSDPAPAVNCGALAQKVVDAATAYGTSQTTQNCKAYLAALNEFVNNGTKCGLSTTDINEAKDEIASTNCP